MNIAVIYGTGRKENSTTYHLAQRVIKKLKGDDKVFEFFLPKDMDQFCVGCYKCIEGSPEKCLAYDQIKPIREAFMKSELIIFTVPVYVFHAPGQVKALLDHFAWEWMVHQLNGVMLRKQALIISTAAGAGMKSTIKDVKDSMDFWGVGRVYTYSKAIFAANWVEIKEEERAKMEAKILQISKRIKKREGDVTPRLKVKLMFYGCRFMHKKMGLNAVDLEHWKKNGWLGKVRPWKMS
nr:NAD(P)H-dependent oxidoreductase [uncultured Niameybacter sp.]